MFSQDIDTRRSGLECLRGFEPNGIATFGDLEDVKSLSHKFGSDGGFYHKWISFVGLASNTSMSASAAWSATGDQMGTSRKGCIVLEQNAMVVSV